MQIKRGESHGNNKEDYRCSSGRIVSAYTAGQAVPGSDAGGVSRNCGSGFACGIRNAGRHGLIVRRGRELCIARVGNCVPLRDMVRGNEHIPGVCGHGSGQSRRRASARRGRGDAYPALHIFAKEKETPSGRNEIFIHGGGADGALPGFRNADDTGRGGVFRGHMRFRCGGGSDAACARRD